MSPSSPEVVVTYLERTAPPDGPPLEAPEGVRLAYVERPSVSFYRRLYDAVGGPWRWSERKRLDDEALRAVIQHPDVHVHVLYRDEEAVGFVELDHRGPDVEIKYLGLVPGAVGQGLGRYLIDRALRAAWHRAPGRVWVHTCTDDHPRALDFYRRHGFTPYRTERKPADAGPPGT